jgi:hypothetical protein
MRLVVDTIDVNQLGLGAFKITHGGKGVI